MTTEPGWKDKKGNPIPPSEIKKITITCSCGWHGHVGQLLAEEDDSTFRCPQCGTSGWVYE